MTETLKLLLLAAAVILCLVESFWSPSPPRPKIGWVGLACLSATFLIP